ncbi:MAG: 50S ribosomal protein L6 [bacterium]
MSRLGRKPLIVPSGVNVRMEGAKVFVKGPKGELSLSLPEGITASLKDNRVEVVRASDSRQHRSLHGLSRTLVANMVEGSEKGYTKLLDIDGVGFKAEMRGTSLNLSLGFSSPVVYIIPNGVSIKVEGNTVVVNGIDKQQVGDVAAAIRRFHPAEPYKGKGIRYRGEYVRRKAGKTVA